MNSGATSERVYEALKQRILRLGFRPGDRLDPSVLADTLSSSVTPVREALHILSGEGLVETRSHGGFHLPLIDEPGLIDLYSWSNEVVTLVLRQRSPGQALVEVDAFLADRTAQLFAAIATLSGNREHARSVASLNQRLHAARMVEPLAIDDAEQEYDHMVVAYRAADRASLRLLLARYHRRRQRLAATVLRLLYRSNPDSAAAGQTIVR